jgi:hypothetical protein
LLTDTTPDWPLAIGIIAIAAPPQADAELRHSFSATPLIIAITPFSPFSAITPLYAMPFHWPLSPSFAIRHIFFH